MIWPGKIPGHRMPVWALLGRRTGVRLLSTRGSPAEKIKKINALLAGLVKTEPQVTLVDTWTLFANPEGDAKPVEPLVKQLEQGGIPSEWRQIEGRDVLTLDLFATPWVRERLESGDPRLEQITLREGELELTGRRSP